jgi:hypothetical protein
LFSSAGGEQGLHVFTLIVHVLAASLPGNDPVIKDILASGEPHGKLHVLFHDNKRGARGVNLGEHADQLVDDSRSQPFRGFVQQ